MMLHAVGKCAMMPVRRTIRIQQTARRERARIIKKSMGARN
jgi:hypothetical protein